MTPKITVITPTNSLKWFHQAKTSLLYQTLADWEWIVLFNGGVFEESDDQRIKCVRSQIGLPNVGALKREACMHATSPYIVEFDHDDELDRDCLALVLDAFEKNKADFVYSDDAHVFQSGKPYLYGKDFGWSGYPAEFNGRKSENLHAYKRPMFLPQNVSRIWFAPDHVRAWRCDSYWKVGGHDAGMRVLDDQDLMCRMLEAKMTFVHIPRCLYKYVVHEKNTWLQNNAEIQERTIQLHDYYIERLVQAFWSGRARCIDLGGGIDSPKGWEKCDTHDADVTCDLNEKWPFADDSVGVFRAHDIIEHLRNPIHTMNEAWRCLTHGGLILIEVPSTDGRGAFQDPTHVSFWNSNSFWYYTREQQQRYVRHAGVNCRFQCVRILNYFPSEWHRANNIPYVRAHLAAIKEGPRLHGSIELEAAKPSAPTLVPEPRKD